MSGATFDEMKSLGWATELTLGRLADSSESSMDLLALIAKKYRIDPAAIATAVGKAVTSATPKPSTGPAAVTDVRMQNAIKNLQGSLTSNLKNLFSHTSTTSIFAEFGSTLKSHSYALKDSTGTLGEFGKGLKVVATLVSGFATLVHRLEDTSNAMTLVYANGIKFDTGLSGLVQASSDAGMKVSEFAGLLSKYGAVSASLGTRSVMALSKQFQSATRFGGELMMSQKEAGEAFFDTLEMMRGSGELLGQSDDQIANRGKTLLMNFNELALATGRNRDELRKQTAQILAQPLISLWARMLPKEGSARLLDLTAKLTAQFGKMAPTIANMIEQVRSGGGGFGLLEDQFRPLLSLVPGFAGALQDAAKSVESGAMTQEQAVKKLGDSLGNMSQSQLMMLRRSNPALAGIVSDMLAERKQAADAYNAREKQDAEEVKRRGINIDQLRAEREATEDRMKNIKGAFNEGNAALARLTNSVSLIATRFSGVLIPAIGILTKGVNGLAWVFEKIAGATEILGDWFTSIADHFEPLITLISDTLTPYIKEVGEMFSSASEGISKFISAITSPISSFFSKKNNDPANPTVRGAAADAGVGMLQIVGTGAAAMVIFKILGNITKVFAGSGGSLLGKLVGSAVKFSGLGSIMKGIGGLGTGLAKGVGGIFEMVGNVIKSGATAIASVIEGLGNILGSVGKALGKGVGGILEGLSGGLTKLGSPMALLGAGVLAALAGTVWLLGNGLRIFNEVNWESMGKAAVAIVALTLASAAAGPLIEFIVPGALAIATAVGLIGAAIGGAAWLAGKGLPQLAEGLRAFAGIDGDALVKTGLGMAALAGGLVILTSAEVVSGLGGLVTGLTSMFSADPVSKLKAFSSVADPLMKTAEALKLISEVMPRAIDAINSLGNIDLTGFGKLRQLVPGALAIATAVGLIGAAIGGEAWLAGKGLPQLAEGLGAFAGIDGDALVKTGLGMAALAGGLVVLTSAEVVSGLGGLVTGLTSMFSADPVSKLKAFSSVSDPLMKTAEALKLISEVMPRAIDAINGLGNIDLTGFGKLRQLLSLTQNVPGGLIANLADVFNSPRVTQGLRDLAQAQTVQRVSGVVPPNSSPGVSPPVITMDEINIKTLAYYEKTVRQFEKMIDLMQNTLDVSTNTNDANKRGFDNLAGAITQIGGVIR